MKLIYKAIATDGKRFAGQIEAKDVKEAARFLRLRKLMPLSITKSENNKDILDFIPFVQKIKPRDVTFFTRQLATMVNTGLTLMQALDILKDQEQNKSMQQITREIISDVEEGKSLSLSLQKHPTIFSPTYIALAKAAETSGLMDKVLVRLADNMEKREKLKSAVRSALIYPIVVVVGMIVVMVVMTVFVLPQLNSLYKSLNVSLPFTTEILLAVTHFIIIFWPFIIGFGVVIWFAIQRWHKTESGGLVLDELSLKIPIFGKIFSLSILTEVTRTLGLMIGAGTLVVEALNQVADVAGNRVYKNAILGVSERVEKGISIGEGFSAYPQFPNILTQMVKIGEQTGKLDESLLKVSEYFEAEVENIVKNISQLMEPFIIIVLGIGVIFLITSIITPIYGLISSFN